MALLAGCFDPRPATGIACSASGDCPDGLVCQANICGGSAMPDDAMPKDVAIDGAIGVAPRLVQQITAVLDHSATLTATLPAAPTVGNVLVMIGANEHQALTSVTGGGATWTFAAGSSTNTNEELWFGITDGSSATLTINCAAGDAQPIWMNISEWSGLASAGPLDVGIASNGLDTPARTDGATTTGAHDLLVVAVADLLPNTFGEPMPGMWQPLAPTVGTAITQSAWYAVVTPGTYAPTVSETGNHWDIVLVGLHGQ